MDLVELKRYRRITILITLLFWAGFGAWCCYGLYRHNHAGCLWKQYQLTMAFFCLTPLVVSFWSEGEDVWRPLMWIDLTMGAIVVASLASEHQSTPEGIALGVFVFSSGFLILRFNKYLQKKKELERQKMKRSKSKRKRGSKRKRRK